jgi:hypothetical protein
VQDFHAHDLVLGIEIQHHAQRNLFRLDDLRFVQAQVQRIGLLVDV